MSLFRIVVTVFFLGGLSACVDNVDVMGGFSQPESAHFHAPTQTWFVSNIAGESGDKDGDGWITTLDRDGNVVDEQWLAGLDSPAGVSSTPTLLVVADVDVVRVIDIESKNMTSIAVDDAGFLNDVFVVDDRTAYVSDTLKHVVYQVDLSTLTATAVVDDEALDGPNGLLVVDGVLWVGSIGSMTDFLDEAPLFAIPLDVITAGDVDVDAHRVGTLQGKFDGVELVDGEIWVSDFRGRIHRVDAEANDGDGALVEEVWLHGAGALSSADFGIDDERGMLLVPDLLGGNVSRVDLQ